MKKIIVAFFPWFFLGFGYKAMAQEDVIKKEEKKETEEIIIRKHGSKNANINVQINGDEVLINGKPLAEFKDDDITVNKRKMTVRSRGDSRTMILNDGDIDIDIPPMTWSNSDEEPGAFLGVSTEKTEEGAKITTVNKESAAAKAGLQNGDIIVKLEDKKIDGPQSLYEAVNTKKPKDEVKITYKRDGKEKTTKAVLGERKSSFSKSYSYSSPDGSYKTFTMPYAPDMDKLNKELEGLNELRGMQDMAAYGYASPARKKLGLKIQDTEEGNGVKILEVEDSSAAALAGLKKDDIITEVGGEKVSNTDQAREQLQENREKGSYAIKARRNGAEMNFTIKIPKKLKTTNL